MSSSGRGAAAVLRRVGPDNGARFLVASAAGVLLFRLLRLAEPQPDTWFALANRLTARVATELLLVSGLEVERIGRVISHPDGFGICVYYLCTAWPISLVMLIGLCALPGRLANKLLPAAAGIAALLVINQLRLVSLFWIGLRLPRAYYVTHHWVWEPIMLLCVGAIWALWIRYRPQTGALL